MSIMGNNSGNWMTNMPVGQSPPPEPLDLDQVCGAIELICNNVMNTAAIDVTVPVTIIKLLNARNGLYMVDHQGNPIRAYCADNSTIYKRDDHVLMLVPRGDWSADKVIIGYVNFEMGLSFADRFQMLNQWRARGPNWLSPAWYWRQRRTNGQGAQSRVGSRNGEILAINFDDHFDELDNIVHSLDQSAWRHYFFDRSDIGLPPDPPLPIPYHRSRMPWQGIEAEAVAEDTRPFEPASDIWETIDTRLFQPFANSFNFIMVRANFQTRFSGIPVTGDYGLLIECYADNPYYETQVNQELGLVYRRWREFYINLDSFLNGISWSRYNTDPVYKSGFVTQWEAIQIDMLEFIQGIDWNLYETSNTYRIRTREVLENFDQMAHDAAIAERAPGAAETRSDEPPYRLVTFRFSCKHFNGNPYNLATPTPQQGVFEVPRGEKYGTIRGLLRVSLYQEGFETDIIQGQQYAITEAETGEPIVGGEILWNTSRGPVDPEPGSGHTGGGGTPARFVLPSTRDEDGNQLVTNNILVTDVDIRFAEQLNLADNLFWIAIETPQGTDVYDYNFTEGNFPENPEVNLIARLFYGRDEVTDPDTCQFHWFREKVSATEADTAPDEKDDFGRTWFDLGGNGWAPIKRIMRKIGDPVPFEGVNHLDRLANWDGTSRNYVLGTTDHDSQVPFNQLRVPVEAVPWKWRYKVVCVYNATPNTPEEANARAAREVIISEIQEIVNPGSQYDFDLPEAAMSNDLTTTFLRVRDNMCPWDPRDPYYENYGQFDTTLGPLQTIFEGTGANRRMVATDWWVDWWADSLTRYHAIPVSPIDRYPHWPLIAGRFNINQFLNARIITFMAEIFSPVVNADQPPNLDEVREVGIVRKTIVQEGEAPFLVEFSGVQAFNYNADGTIKHASSTQNAFVQAHIRWAGSNYQEYCVEWLGPDKKTLLNRMGGNENESPELGFNLHTSMMKDMFSDANNIVRFQVRSYHDSQRTDNTFILRIRLVTGETYEFPRQIHFTKDGAQGTHGSEWSAPIWPTNLGTLGGVGYNSDDQFEQFTRLITCARPLVLYGQVDGIALPSLTDVAPGGISDSGNVPLVLRPFITKNGVPLEQLPKVDGYSYEVYWDTRYTNQVWDADDCDVILPNSPDFQARFGSFIGLQQPDAELPLGGIGGPDAPMGTTANVGSPTTMAAMQVMGKTSWSPDACDGKFGAVRVRWLGVQQTGVGNASLRQMNFACVVKAQIDIYKEPDDGEKTKVATIFSYWPVDLLLANNGPSGITPLGYNPDYIRENLPRFVDYNPSGYNPQVFSSPLFFYYGENRFNQTPPLPYPAFLENLNDDLATLVERLETDDYGNEIPGTERRFFEPSPHFMAKDGVYGAIRVIPDPSFQWGSARFIRPILFRLMIHANADINAWDGRSISMKEDRGVILAPTVGAGWKHPYTNTFSGVIMGIDKSKRKSPYHGTYGGFSQDEIRKNPYVTGLFGYQNGVSSFGILENGSAYFGRADRGRIIFDGINAQIGGGASLGRSQEDMRNRMRLSFIDFHGTDENTGRAIVDPRRNPSNPDNLVNSAELNVQDGIGSIDGPCGSTRVNSRQLRIDRRFRPFFVPGATFENPNLGDPYGGFYGEDVDNSTLGAGFATPAIEIGQYTPPGSALIRSLTVCETRDNHNFNSTALDSLEIPGNRRFLVTYDGTMYAMNGFFKGNVVASNIIGAQFFNGDGTFAVTRAGSLGIGKGIDWTIRRVRPAEGSDTMVSLWGGRVPTRNEGEDDVVSPNEAERISSVLESEGPDVVADFLGTGCDFEKPNQGFNFFVSRNGTVIANRMHLRGGSLNIGNFHVVGTHNTDGEYEPGDVVSYGTMYLVGGRPSPNPPPINAAQSSNSSSLIAWGDAYFRGKLTNLGPVYFGGTPEKLVGVSNQGPHAPGEIASSMNSPFSIVSTFATPNPTQPTFPVRIGCWPLYFHNTPGALDNFNENHAWVCLSTPTGDDPVSGNGFMPGFGVRPLDSRNFIGGAIEDLSPRPVWRVDQCGMWSDAIFFTRRNTGWGINKTDLQAFKPEDDGLGFLGWCHTERNAGQAWALMLKSISTAAPRVMIEALRDTRMSAGRRDDGSATGDGRGGAEGTLPGDPNFCHAIVDAWTGVTGSPSTGSREALFIASAEIANTRGTAICSARGEVCLIGRRGGAVNPNSVTAFLNLNSLGLDSGQRETYDEFGENLATIPAYRPGQIWMRGSGISFDSLAPAGGGTPAADAAPDVTGGQWQATVRVGRRADGEGGTAEAPGDGGWDDHAGGPGGVYIGARKGIVIGGPNPTATTDSATLRVVNIDPEYQFGIYARFG